MNVTLLSDFGTRDGYVGALKGSLLQRAPGARLIDLSHDIAPGAIASGAFVLAQAAPHFPSGTVHLAVVDPGVGSLRRAIACEIGGHHYVAPDNGLLTLVLDLGGTVRAHLISRSELWNSEVSPVFHGRDIFAPVAGHLAGGGRLAEVGPSIDPLTLVRLPEPEVRSLDAALVGEVVHVDRFGNLITNLRRQADERADMLVEAAGRTLQLRRAYVDVPQGELLALVGSSGRVEIACNGASAAKVLGAEVGAVVVLRTLGRS